MSIAQVRTILNQYGIIKALQDGDFDQSYIDKLIRKVDVAGDGDPESIKDIARDLESMVFDDSPEMFALEDEISNYLDMLYGVRMSSGSTDLNGFRMALSPEWEEMERKAGRKNFILNITHDFMNSIYWATRHRVRSRENEFREALLPLVESMQKKFEAGGMESDWKAPKIEFSNSIRENMAMNDVMDLIKNLTAKYA